VGASSENSIVPAVASPVAARLIAVWEEVLKTAVSESLGCPAGVQLSAVFHSPLAGCFFQVDVVICSA
jgi:H+/Cl- antiporter ClcA